MAALAALPAVPDLRRRAVEGPESVEKMDDPDCDRRLLEQTYAQFPLVNALVSGWRSIYRRSIRPALSNTQPSTLLDVGCGGGDVARSLAKWAAEDNLLLRVTAIDPDTRAHAYAVDHARDYARTHPGVAGVDFRQAFSSELVAEGARFDFVISNHVLHHLSAPDLGALLADSERLARRQVLHGDIERGAWAYRGFSLMTSPLLLRWPGRERVRPLIPASFIREDGLTSIRRSFTAAELRAAVPAGWQVTSERPSRLLLTWAPHA